MVTLEDLSVRDALTIILDDLRPLPSEQVPLLDAVGRVLAEQVFAQDVLPPFTNSAMDGYVVRAADTSGASSENPVKLKVVGDIPAGKMPDFKISRGTAARVMTGAPIAPGGDAVVPVELTDELWRESDRPLPDDISISRSVEHGSYIRQHGEDIQVGDEVLPAGHTIRPHDLGLLASLGITKLRVTGRPRVGILATGDELVSTEEPLAPGKIRNSNSVTQAAQVIAAGGEPIILGVARDRVSDVRSKLMDGLRQHVNLLVSSAGVSVGAFDVVKHILEEEGEVKFWRVRMRPGKPLTFGRYDRIPYIGLPGNPVSAAVSFERFVRPAILKLSGKSELERPRIWATTQESIRSDGRESYIRVIVEKDGERYQARIAGGQGSHIMSAMLRANGLAIVPEGVELIQKGELVETMMIEWPESVF